MRAAHAMDGAARRAAEDDRLALRDRTSAAYPFHPALIETLKREGRAGGLLGPGDIPIEDSDVAHAFFTEVGQREPFQAVLQRDFIGPNARVKRIDERLAQEHPGLSGVRPAMRIATAILAYSFGGLLRAGEDEGEPIATGVTESELLAAVIGPDLDSLTAQAVLKKLRGQCLFGVPGFPRLESEATLRQAIAQGVQQGTFGYVGRAGQAEIDRLKEGGGYLVSPKAARIGLDLPEVEIDLSSAFIVLPQAIEREFPPTPEPTSPFPPGVTPTLPEPAGVGVGITPLLLGAEPQTTVRLNMRMTRQQLYASFNAIGNLAEAAGNIRMTVEAQKLDGFDPTWLRNAVLEPLDGADVEVEE